MGIGGPVARSVSDLIEFECNPAGKRFTSSMQRLSETLRWNRFFPDIPFATKKTDRVLGHSGAAISAGCCGDETLSAHRAEAFFCSAFCPPLSIHRVHKKHGFGYLFQALFFELLLGLELTGRKLIFP